MIRWVVVLVLCCAQAAWGERIGQFVEVHLREQILRLLQLSDATLRYGLTGAFSLGLNCGLLGAFLLLRRMAILGDVVGHSVLPGVVIGYVVVGSKSLFAMGLGAWLAGLASAGAVSWLGRSTRLRQDAQLGMVLSVFFALGVALMTIVQHHGEGNQAGLDRFLFGQAAALGPAEVRMQVLGLVVSLLFVVLLFKELTVTSFDPLYADCVGISTRRIGWMFLALVSLSIVVGIQSVGVVLVSAMLVIPAATARLLTVRLVPMVLLSGGFGALSSTAGLGLSFLGSNLSTGPCMVLSASVMFALAWLFSPQQGVFARWLFRAREKSRLSREHLVKALYKAQESRNLDPLAPVSLPTLSRASGESAAFLLEWANKLRHQGYVRWVGEELALTKAGLELARSIVRKHRLWELYLTRQGNLDPAKVHRDADRVEHVLTTEQVELIEEGLGRPETDPHGKPIPNYPPRRKSDV